jgi:hypothetical protein
VLGDCSEDTWWERHVEYPVGLAAAVLEFLQMLLQLNERLVLVVLARDVCAVAAKLVQLLLKLLRGCLDVGLDAPEVLLVVHLRPRISDDTNVLGEEVVAMLEEGQLEVGEDRSSDVRDRRVPGTVEC